MGNLECRPNPCQAGSSRAGVRVLIQPTKALRLVSVSDFPTAVYFDFRTFRGHEIACFASVCYEAGTVLPTLGFERGCRNSSGAWFFQLHREDQPKKMRNSNLHILVILSRAVELGSASLFLQESFAFGTYGYIL